MDPVYHIILIAYMIGTPSPEVTKYVEEMGFEKERHSTERQCNESLRRHAGNLERFLFSIEKKLETTNTYVQVFGMCRGLRGRQII